MISGKAPFSEGKETGFFYVKQTWQILRSEISMQKETEGLASPFLN